MSDSSEDRWRREHPALQLFGGVEGGDVEAVLECVAAQVRRNERALVELARVVGGSDSRRILGLLRDDS